MGQYTLRFPIEICQLIIEQVVETIETTRALASIPQLAPLFQSKLCYIIIEDENFKACSIVDQAMENMRLLGNVIQFKVVHPLRCTQHDLPLSDGKCLATVGYGSDRICGTTYVSRDIYKHCLENDLESRRNILYLCQRFSNVVFKTGMISNKLLNIEEYVAKIESLVVDGCREKKTHYNFALRIKSPDDLSESWRLVKSSVAFDCCLNPVAISQSGRSCISFFSANTNHYNFENQRNYIFPRFGSEFQVSKEHKTDKTKDRNLIIDVFTPSKEIAELQIGTIRFVPISILRFIHPTKTKMNSSSNIPYFITEEFMGVLQSLNNNMKERFLEALHSFFFAKINNDINKLLKSNSKQSSLSASYNNVSNLITSRITMGTSSNRTKILRFLAQYRTEFQEYSTSNKREKIWVDFQETLDFFHSQSDSIDNLVYVITLNHELNLIKNEQYLKALKLYGAEYVFNRRNYNDSMFMN